MGARYRMTFIYIATIIVYVQKQVLFSKIRDTRTTSRRPLRMLDLDEPFLVTGDTVPPMGVMGRLTIERDEVQHSGPIRATVCQRDSSLVRDKTLATSVGHRNEARVGTWIHGEKGTDVLRVEEESIGDHVALIRIGTSPSSRETIGIAFCSADIGLSLFDFPAAWNAVTVVGLYLDVIVFPGIPGVDNSRRFAVSKDIGRKRNGRHGRDERQGERHNSEGRSTNEVHRDLSAEPC